MGGSQKNAQRKFLHFKYSIKIQLALVKTSVFPKAYASKITKRSERSSWASSNKKESWQEFILMER